MCSCERDGSSVCVCCVTRSFSWLKGLNISIWYAAFHLCFVTFPHCHMHDFHEAVPHVCHICAKAFVTYLLANQWNYFYYLKPYFLITIRGTRQFTVKCNASTWNVQQNMTKPNVVSSAITILLKWNSWVKVERCLSSQQQILAIGHVMVAYNHLWSCLFQQKWITLGLFVLGNSQLRFSSCAAQWYHSELLRSCLPFLFFF